MKIKVEDSKLPNNVYDIVIDPGHGGVDSGAINGNYYESEITLEYSLILKEELEKLGLKVKLIRDSNVKVDSYGDNGRAVIPNTVKAKYIFSVHLNSNVETMKKGGVEIYAHSKMNLNFAKLLADNIVSIAKTTYSPNNIHKVDNGIYVRNYTDEDIKEATEYAVQAGYTKYNITTNTPYLFMLRETGGIATNAYIDGRNKNYGVNKYYNSNVGVESYLLELGFMNCKTDLDNIVSNKKLYVDAITASVKQYLNIE
jgi:N-acetylmuramoyl-L-alanine amidase